MGLGVYIYLVTCAMQLYKQSFLNVFTAKIGAYFKGLHLKNNNVLRGSYFCLMLLFHFTFSNLQQFLSQTAFIASSTEI